MPLALAHPRSPVVLELTEYYGLYIGLDFVLLLAHPGFSLVGMLCKRAGHRLRPFWHSSGVHYERYSRLHSWLAAINITEVVLHTVLAVKQQD